MVGAVILIDALRRLLRVRGIYIHGMPALATVISVSSTSMWINHWDVMCVHYTFDTFTWGASGRIIFHHAVPKVGPRIWVLHDLEDPDRNVAA